MKRTAFLAIAVTLVLAGCAAGRLGDGLNGYSVFLVQRPNPMLPNIFVDKAGGPCEPVAAAEFCERLVIDQEPIHLRGYDFPQTISWALPSGSDYQFLDKKALVSVLRGCTGANLVDKLNCSVGGKESKTLECVFPPRFFDARVKYCYSLTVRNTKTNTDIRTDPSIVSD